MCVCVCMTRRIIYISGQPPPPNPNPRVGGASRTSERECSLIFGVKVHCCCSQAPSSLTDSSLHFARSPLPNIPSS